MDNFFKNLKEKFTLDNLFGMVKESKIVQDIAQEEMKRSLEKLDPRNLSTDEITSKISNAAETSKQIIEGVSKIVSEDTLKTVVDGVTIINTAKAGITAITKSNENILKDSEKESDSNSFINTAKAGLAALAKASSENITKFSEEENKLKSSEESDEIDPVWDI